MHKAPSLNLDGNLSLVFEEDAYRRYPVTRIEPSPCTQACPAGVNVKAYVSLIAAGRFAEALQVVRERNPLPGICGRVCTHPCEAYCNRAQVDAPVAICWLKRFVADYELQHGLTPPTPSARTRPERVAVVGSGPAGLTAAHDLARKGYRVTVFEALSRPGGMLAAGIPAFRLPRDILQYEIGVIEKSGVEIRCGQAVAGEHALDELFEAGYGAVFLAVGAHKSRKLGVPGEDAYRGVLDAVSFLRKVNLGRAPKLGRRVAVIGGGNSAVDAARTAVRLGSEVRIVYRRTRKEMPAGEYEIRQAEIEGVQIDYLAAPVEVLGQRGRVTGLRCVRMKLGEPDDSGRRRPIPIPGSEFTLEVDTILPAVSQEPDLSFLPADQGVRVSRRHTLEVDPETLATARPGVFAGGDAVTGPNTVIDAIAAGHVAARSIERYLRGDPLQPPSPAPGTPELEIKPDLKRRKKQRRAEMPTLPTDIRVAGFQEVELGFREAVAVEEARRCLRCGPCRECLVCVPECRKLVTVLSPPDSRDETLFRLPEGSEPLTRFAHIKAGRRKPTPVELTPPTCYVQPEVCRGCGDCVTACEYGAPVLLPRGNGLYVARIDESLCKGCGTCVAVCPSSAIVQRAFSPDWLEQKLATLDPQKKNVVVFHCTWYASHLPQSPFEGLAHPDVHLVFARTPCTGRIEASFVLRAFERGAEGVLVVGCARNACHYGFGNRFADQHFGTVQNLLSVLGLPSEKFQWAWPEAEQFDAFVATVDWFLQSMREGRVCEKVIA